MTLGAWLFLGASVPIVAMLGLQWWMGRSVRAGIGQVVPAAGPAVDPAQPALVYFYSPSCGPCRAMAPAVDALIAEGRPVHKVDVSRSPEQAKAWNVMATPTTVAVRAGHITDVALGAIPKARLLAMLA